MPGCARVQKKAPQEVYLVGAASHERPVSTGRDGESERRDGVRGDNAIGRHDGKKRKGPSRIFLKGPENPAATYSPGSEDQVPSAI